MDAIREQGAGVVQFPGTARPRQAVLGWATPHCSGDRPPAAVRELGGEPARGRGAGCSEAPSGSGPATSTTAGQS